MALGGGSASPCCRTLVATLRRLEVFSEGAWGPVCADGFGAGAAAVSCKQMGFSGAQEGGFAACAARGDRDYCNEHAPVWSSVACSGSEMVLSDCAAEKNADVYCAPSESIVIACAGDGQTEGGAPAGEAPRVEKSLFAPKRRLSCDSTLESEMLTDASPGSTYVASCPAGCSANIVFGSIAYSAASSICGASVHGGAAGNAGGDVVVVVGHGQDSYFGSACWRNTRERAARGARRARGAMLCFLSSAGRLAMASRVKTLAESAGALQWRASRPRSQPVSLRRPWQCLLALQRWGCDGGNKSAALLVAREICV